MKKKLLALLLAAAMIFVMCGCGSSDSASEEGQAEGAIDTGQNASAADVVGEYYQFEIDGTEYAMPCPLADFTNAGWFVSEEELNYELEPNTQTFVDVYTDDSAEKRAFSTSVANLTENKIKISECTVISLSVNQDDACCSSITMKKAGVKIDVSGTDATAKTGEDLKAAYGTDEAIFTDEVLSDERSLSWEFSELIDDEEQGGIVIGAREATTINLDANFFSLDYAGFVF